MLMKNKFVIENIDVSKNKVCFEYNVYGEWVKYFNLEEKLYLEYNLDVSKTPKSIAVIPLICNILPIAWICDAKIELDCCDEDFLNSIEDIKKGYINMYPMIEFKGSIDVKKIEKNIIKGNQGGISFFSGGVDSFDTLIRHKNENLALLTVWGSDIRVDDENGWNNVLNHVNLTSNEMKLENYIVKSNFRRIINYRTLEELAKKGNENWWHGFQHGIGVISLAFPLLIPLEKRIIYFASTHTIKDKGVTCASDPTIDNCMKTANVEVIHDGYECNRQEKIHNITEFVNQENKNLNLRVCWQESSGKNCCECEKCWRTILGLIAENVNPQNYGLSYSIKQLKKFKYIYYYQDIPSHCINWYVDIQKQMKMNVSYDKLPKEIKWFYNLNIDKLGRYKYRKFMKKIKNKIMRTIKKG